MPCPISASRTQESLKALSHHLCFPRCLTPKVELQAKGAPNALLTDSFLNHLRIPPGMTGTQNGLEESIRELYFSYRDKDLRCWIAETYVCTLLGEREPSSFRPDITNLIDYAGERLQVSRRPDRFCYGLVCGYFGLRVPSNKAGKTFGWTRSRVWQGIRDVTGVLNKALKAYAHLRMHEHATTKAKDHNRPKGLDPHPF